MFFSPRRLSCFGLLMVAALLTLSAPAQARKRVEWSAVEVRSGDDAKRVAKLVRRLLKRATRRTKWGKPKSTVKLRAKVTKLHWDLDVDVLRLTVTMVASVEGGKTARSHIRVGGRASERRKLERQTLKIVVGGLVTRLADMVRRQTKR